MKRFSSFSATFVVLALLHAVATKDLRIVTEPKNPVICTSLNATSDDDTETIQKALNSCTKGQAVALTSGNTFNTGPLTIPSDVSLLVEKGALLKAIPNPKLYDKGANTCGWYDDNGNGCNAFITILKANGSGIYGEGTIDGQGGAHINSQKLTWWKLIRRANELNKRANNPRLIHINDSTDITLYQIVLKNSPQFHVASTQTYGLTLWKVIIYSPKATSDTDGVVLEGSQNVTIAHTNITTVSDNIGITASDAPSKHISMYNLHLNRGYGISIGGATKHGISNVNFSNLTLTIVNYGINIRSNTLNGGPVTNITYHNVCLYRVWYPIVLDMFYGNVTGDQKPQFKNIFLNEVYAGNSGNYIFHGIDESDPIEVELNDVHVAKGSSWSVSKAEVTGNWKYDLRERHCPHNVNI
uniref:Glycoside hydrolase family 28 n=1 Tax=Medauroidea extradentata TaxID=614211 RepID=A0A191XT15_9NEOP|nr:glycoside hydrolase family 28 [Medauroidea extradentata]